MGQRPTYTKVTNGHRLLMARLTYINIQTCPTSESRNSKDMQEPWRSDQDETNKNIPNKPMSRTPDPAWTWQKKSSSLIECANPLPRPVRKMLEGFKSRCKTLVPMRLWWRNDGILNKPFPKCMLSIEILYRGNTSKCFTACQQVGEFDPIFQFDGFFCCGSCFTSPLDFFKIWGTLL